VGSCHGAGHGNTFQDNFGNYWNTGTPWVAVNWNFERRIAMFPAGFDRDDQMFRRHLASAISPHYLPTGKWTDRDALFNRLDAPVVSQAGHRVLGARYVPAANVTDEDPRTFWVAQA